MKEYRLPFIPVDHKQYLKKVPTANEYNLLIKEDAIFYDPEGSPIIIYKVLPKNIIDSLRHLAFDSKFTKSARSNGIPTQSAIFGALPRVTYRNDFCRFTVNTRTQKKLLADVLRFSDVISGLYKKYLPEQYQHNIDIITQNVVDDYVIKGTPFTTVNFNVNHAIKYHTDTGNFKGVYSNVVIMKNNIIGGYLVVPEYRIAFEQTDGALILFDGQKILHGVTPILRTKNNGYRCSCVFYSLASMKNCYPYKEEMQRAKTTRTKVESVFRPDPMEISGYKKFKKNHPK